MREKVLKCVSDSSVILYNVKDIRLEWIAYITSDHKRHLLGERRRKSLRKFQEKIGSDEIKQHPE